MSGRTIPFFNESSFFFYWRIPVLFSLSFLSEFSSLWMSCVSQFLSPCLYNLSDCDYCFALHLSLHRGYRGPRHEKREPSMRAWLRMYSISWVILLITIWISRDQHVSCGNGSDESAQMSRLIRLTGSIYPKAYFLRKHFVNLLWHTGLNLLMLFIVNLSICSANVLTYGVDRFREEKENCLV